jgi:shikimate dehydrogenase
MPDLKLGLIGDNISRSKAPLLHQLAGKLLGLEVRYDRLVPKDLGRDFDGVFEDCVREGYRGINVTYPYKERVVPKVRIDDPLVRPLAAVNTMVFAPGGPTGHNTDYSGFMAAYRKVAGDAAPGAVCMIGAGGVGKAVAFALMGLGLKELRLVERDLPKAEALAAAMKAEDRTLGVTVTADPAEAAAEAYGIINCTPVGMVGYGGTLLPRELMAGASWAFDAVYTPVDTQFLKDAKAEGLTIISGYELFF